MTSPSAVSGHRSVTTSITILILSLIVALQLLFVDHLTIAGTGWRVNFPWTGLAIVAAVMTIRQWNRRTTEMAGDDSLLVFWFSLFLFLSTFRWHGSDDLPTSLLPFCIWQQGTLHLDSFRSWFPHPGVGIVPARGNHWVSFYPVTGALMALPVYALPAWRGAIVDDHVVHQLEKISASLICAVATLVFYRIIRRQTDRRWAATFALAWAAGTAVFSLCSQALWQYGPSCLCLVSALWGMDRALRGERSWAIAGFFSGLAVTARPPDIFFAIAIGAVALVARGPKAFVEFVLGGAAPAIFLALYWFIVIGTGRPADYGFQQDLLHWPPRAAAIAGLLISPARGILLYSPVMIFAIVGWWHTFRLGNRDLKTGALFLGGAVLVNFLFFGCYDSWIGGTSFGPRYLIDAVTVLFYFIAASASTIKQSGAARALWIFCLALSVSCSALGAYNRWDWEALLVRTSVWTPATYPLLYAILPTTSPSE